MARSSAVSPLRTLSPSRSLLFPPRVLMPRARCKVEGLEQWCQQLKGAISEIAYMVACWGYKRGHLWLEGGQKRATV